MRSRALDRAGRRRFLQWLGLIGVWGALGGPGFSFAQSAPPRAGSAKATTGKQPAASDEARTLALALRARYPDHIAESDLETIARDLDGDLKGGRRLRERKLGNSVEPDVVFRA